MRIAALAAVVLVLAGCGSAASQTSSKLGTDAASLVPADAEAFVSVDTNFDSQQWHVLGDLAGPKLQLEKLKAAAGEALSLAVLADGTAVAFAKPHDQAKLQEVATKFDKGDEHYTVKSVQGWAVVADSQKAFDQVQAAGSGKSLADDASFRAAEATLSGSSLAAAFLNGQALKELGTAKWFAARVTGDANALQLDVHAQSLKPAPADYKPMLLRDVPSGAIAAVSFKDLDKPLAQLHGAERYLGVPLAQLLPALRGEGVFYVLQGTLVPTFALEVQSPDPAAAEHVLRTAAAKIKQAAGGALVVRVSRYGSRVVLTNAPASTKSLGGALVDDQPFKDALAAAGAPERVTFLAYADVQRLKPLLETLAQLAGGTGSSSTRFSTLDRIDNVVAFGTPSRLVVRAVLK
jgi:hypothetical protein